MTDEGFAEVALALVETLKYDGDQGKVVRLEELCLTNNRLSATSLQALSPIIRLASNDLRDLDLSENNITIDTEAEATLWEDFLISFKQCCSLRRIDLSGNALGLRAFEVLTRIYAKQDAVDLGFPANFEHVDSDDRRTLTDTAGLERTLSKISVVSRSDGWSSDRDQNPKFDGHKGSRHGRSATSYLAELVDSLLRFEIIRKSWSSSFPTRVATLVRYDTGTQVCTVYCFI